MSPVVVVDRVGKRYVVEHQKPTSLRERFVRRRWRGTSFQELWALRDVSLEVGRGEVFGVLGANGSGKSTLLRLVAGVMRPTVGKVTVRGRVGALLDLTAGFHPELTGLENIELQAALLGMGKAEVAQKRADIVAFSGLESFIDSPVKYYSSGMLMRLGFAIAIHLEPDVLVVDEVLAVGDEEFQTRCVERIGQLCASGGSVLLVTHDMDQIRRLCQKALWLDHGRVRCWGRPEVVVEQYVEATRGRREESGPQAARWGSREVEILGVTLVGGLRTRQPCAFRIHYVAHQPVEKPVFGLAIHREDGLHIAGPNTSLSRFPIPAAQGHGTVDFCVQELPLLPGAYYLSAAVYDEGIVHPFDHHHAMYRFEVPPLGEPLPEGIVELKGTWRHTPGSHDVPQLLPVEVSHA